MSQLFQPTFQIKTIEENEEGYARIVIEPLEQGFGQTLGIALRRVLLQHISGAAVTRVQIAGVNHQFTTLEGLKEDIVEFILNVKQIKLIYQGKEPVKATLKAIGPGDITAEQIELPSGVELANPDLVLAHLAEKKSKLDVTFEIESGKGYLAAEEQEVSTLGIIPLDATFSPVLKVNINVSDTRVGRLTNFDKLTIDIWTDRTVKPEVALKEAARILEGHFEQIISPVDSQNVDEEVNMVSEPEAFSITVEELELPTRIANALRKAGLGTVRDLVKVTKSEISKIKNLGGKSVDLVASALKAKGMKLADG